MDELISRQAAIDKLKRLSIPYWFEDEVSFLEDGRVIEIIITNKALEAIERLSPVHPEQKTGRWECVDDDMNVYKCTACGEEWCIEAGTPKENNMLFCNRCGAKMERMSENEENTDTV